MSNIQYDSPTYPELGKIYPGDYYADLPFDDYIDRSQPLPCGKNVFDIRDFGAIPEEGRLNTEAFMAASKACEEAGGGTILVAGGSYWMGSVRVPSHTTLFIAPDAEIVASRDFQQMNNSELEGEGNEHGQSGFLLIGNAEYVTVTGGGRICGNGEWYVYEPRELPSLKPFEVTALPRRDQAKEINSIPNTVRYFYRQRIRYAEDKYNEGKPPLQRPGFLVLVRKSQHIIFENIILHDSMAWTLNLESCFDVTVRNLVIDDNRHVANSDGIDVSGSSNVRIEHCFVSCADDGIVLKNHDHCGQEMKNIHVRDCTVLSVMSAFKIGTETGHDITNVLVEDCHFCLPDIYPGSVTGISLESCDGTNLSNVTIRNITMDKIVCPLYICLNMRNRYHDPYTDEVGSNRYWGGSIRNIVLQNIKATNAELPSIITGFEAKKADGTTVRKAVQNVWIENFSVVYRDNNEVVTIPDTFEEFLYDYPESNAHGDVDAYGIWVRHADQITLKGIQIQPRSCNTREMIKLYDVSSCDCCQ
jgi:polygalacturonase